MKDFNRRNDSTKVGSFATLFNVAEIVYQIYEV